MKLSIISSLRSSFEKDCSHGRLAVFLLHSALAVLIFLLSTGWSQMQGQNEGVMATLTYVSPDHGAVDLLVYTPPGYYSPGNTDRYPVLYVLHGSGDTETALAEALDELPLSGDDGGAKMDNAILSGYLPPMILVGVGSPNGSWGEELGSLVTEQVPAFVDRNWRTVADRRGRSIEGFSSGARGVARYLTPKAEGFASASILGGGFENFRWADYAQSLRVRGLQVNILSGDQDQFLAGAQELASLLDTEGIANQLEILPGVPHSHNLIYEARGLENLQFHASVWASRSVVEAGPDMVIDGGAPASVEVAGEVLDGGTYATDWQQIHGPGNGATFTNNFAPGTSVTFSEIGTYALRFTASDSSGTYEDVLTVSVVDLDDSMEMHLPLDSDALDATGNGHDGVEQGAQVTPLGKIGGAYSFDGIDDFLTVPDFNYGPEYSIAFWFRAPDLYGSSYQYMWSHNGFDQSQSLNVYLPESNTSSHGSVRSVLRDANDANGKYIDAVGTFSDGAWHHFTMVVDASGSRVFVDGRETMVSAQGGDTFDPTTDIFLGGRSKSPAGRYFEGSIDDVRLYSRRLQKAEAHALGFTLGADQPPTVDAGPDVGIQELEDAYLLAGVTDDDVSSLSLSWSQDSGPGTATFSHPTDASTSVSFDLPGIYNLRLTATDSQGSASDTVAVTIQAASAPLGHWLLNESSGNMALDQSFQRNDGDLVSSPEWTGTGLSFDSSSSQAVIVGQSESLDLDPATEDISLVAWIRIGPGAEGTIIGKAYGSLSQRQYQLYLYDAEGDGMSSIYGLIGGKSNNNAKYELVDDNQWHLVAVVHDSSTMTNLMYVDGVAAGDWKSSGSATNNVDVMLGARRNTSSNYGIGWALDGEIGEARVYAWKLMPEEMAALYALGPE